MSDANVITIDNCRVGMDVWDVQKGKGSILRLDLSEEYFVIFCEFEDGDVESYTKDGKIHPSDINPSLYKASFKDGVWGKCERTNPPSKLFTVSLYKKGCVSIRQIVNCLDCREEGGWLKVTWQDSQGIVEEYTAVSEIKSYNIFYPKDGGTHPCE